MHTFESKPHRTHLVRSSSTLSRTLSATLSLPFLALALLLSPSALAQRPLGIDVSKYQGSSINWNTVKANNIVFAVAKATEGTTGTDATYVGNVTGAKAAGVYIGAYHYCHSELNTAATEAAHFWSVAGPYLKGDGKSLMPMLDLEGSALTGHVGASTVSDWVNQWCNAIVAYGAADGLTLKPIIYTSACHASYLDSSVAQWIPWIANYNGQDPQTGTPWSACSGYNVWGPWVCWQYSSCGVVPGIGPGTCGCPSSSAGCTDLDVFNGTLASLVTKLVIPAAGNAATFVSSSVPSGVSTGQTFSASVTFHNSGGGAWTNTGTYPYKLGSQSPQDNTTWGVSRVALPASPISPGANVTFTLNATAPATPGVYTFAWRMVQEGKGWFGDTFSTTLTVNQPGPGTNYGNYTLDSGNLDSTSRGSGYASLTTTCSGATAYYTYGVPKSDGSCTVFDRDIRWMPALPRYGVSGRGYLTASALIPNDKATATVNFYAVDAAGNDLPGPLTGAINECAYSCSWVTFFSGPIHVTSLGGFRSNPQDDGPPTSGGCSTTCGYFPAGYSQLRIQAARWQYIDDWTCLGPYPSGSVSDSTGRGFSDANLYLYPAIDTTHGNAIAPALGYYNQVPGHVNTGDCNNSNTLNFGGANNGVSPAGNAAAFGNTNNADAYGFAWVFAPAGASPKLVIGSADGNRVWVNGVLKNDTNATRPLVRDQDTTAAVTLAAGWNRILFKLHNFSNTFQGTISLRNGSDVNLNEPSVNYYDLGGYYSYGLGSEQDGWYPQIVVTNVYGVSNPAHGAALYGNNTSVTVRGVSNGQGPVPYWRTMQYQWGSGLGSTDSNYADVSGTPTSASWSHTATGVTGHRRLHFFAVSRSGRTSFQNSGSSGGAIFQDAGNYARYYDVFVDNVPPLAPAFSGLIPAATNAIDLVWDIPLDQGVNTEVGATESAGAGGNQEAQNWYRVGDVAVQVYRDGSVLAPWSTTTFAHDSGLTPNTAYTYALAARDNHTGTRGTWHNSSGLTASTVAWTLSLPPTAGSLVPSPAAPYTGSNITWTAVNGFGPGQVQYYRYAWDTTPTHTWTDTEPQWSSGTLATLATAPGTWYLHVKGYNGADVANGTFDYAINVQSSIICSQTNAVLGITDNHNGTFTLAFIGTPQAEYCVLMQTNPAAPAALWTPLPGSTNTPTNSSGLWLYTVTNTGPQRFYRSAASNPCP